MPTVLILGATSDIAIAVAKKFSTRKYNIQLAGRDINQLKPIQSDIHIRHGVDCSIHQFDVLEFASHQLFFDSLSPKPDITISVVGVMYDEDKAFDDWQITRKMIDTNYTGLVSVLNIVAKYYSVQKQGSIVGVSSVAGDRGRQSKLIYGSAKAAFSAYLSGLRNKLAKENVHVVTVKPGFVYTKMTAELKLPPLLTAYPAAVAESIFRAVEKNKNVIYVKWFWRWIMLIIKCIPEFQFKKMKL